VKLLTISVESWPPNSPDMNPNDYKIWRVLQQHVYETWVNYVDELKQRLVDVWSGLQHSIVDAAVSEWRKHLQACVRTKAVHSNICCREIRQLKETVNRHFMDSVIKIF